MRATKRFTILALLCAMAITLNLMETFYIPPMFGIFRIGLANIIALIAMHFFGVKEMLEVNAMRVVIGNLLSGRFLGSTFWISFGGVILSSLILILMYKMKSSLLFTSIMSSIAHSVGQVFVVMFFYQTALIITVLPYFLLLSIPTGLLTGWVSQTALKRLKVQF